MVGMMAGYESAIASGYSRILKIKHARLLGGHQRRWWFESTWPTVLLYQWLENDGLQFEQISRNDSESLFGWSDSVEKLYCKIAIFTVKHGNMMKHVITNGGIWTSKFSDSFLGHQVFFWWSSALLNMRIPRKHETMEQPQDFGAFSDKLKWWV